MRSGTPQTRRGKRPPRQQRRILLQMAKVTRLEGVWRKTESRGVTDKDIEGAVRWARKRK